MSAGKSLTALRTAAGREQEGRGLEGEPAEGEKEEEQKGGKMTERVEQVEQEGGRG